jgi:Holliday junction resolvase RusA-like endonuclease
MTRTGRVYLNKSHLAFKDLVNKQLSKEDIKISDKKLCLEISFYGCRTNADIDNMLKSLFDSMNGIVYEDDKQIYKITVTKNCTGSKHTVIVVSDYVE